MPKGFHFDDLGKIVEEKEEDFHHTIFSNR
jgi:hypothetical protein